MHVSFTFVYVASASYVYLVDVCLRLCVGVKVVLVGVGWLLVVV